MNEDDNDILMEYLCESGELEPCKRCNPTHYEFKKRTFDTWQDLGDLKYMLEAKKELPAFLEFAFESDLDGDGNQIEDLAENARDDGEKFYNSDFIAWILNPKSFCQLVADYLKEKP